MPRNLRTNSGPSSSYRCGKTSVSERPLNTWPQATTGYHARQGPDGVKLVPRERHVVHCLAEFPAIPQCHTCLDILPAAQSSCGKDFLVYLCHTGYHRLHTEGATYLLTTRLAHAVALLCI